MLTQSKNQYHPQEQDHTVSQGSFSIKCNLAENNTMNESSLFEKSMSVLAYSKMIQKYHDKRTIRKQTYQLKDNKSNKDDRNRRQIQRCNYINIIDECIPFQLSSAKKFILVGGIIVELSDAKNSDLCIDKIHLIKNVLKKTDGSLSMNIQIIQSQHQYDIVIKILQSTQCQEDYLLSLQLIKVQKYFLTLQQQIQKIRSIYNPLQLEQLVQLRKKFTQEQLQKYSESLLSEDDFGVSAAYILDWDTQLIGTQQLIMTNPFIAMVGLNSDDFILYIMRKSYLQLLTLQSRSRIFRKTIDVFSVDNETNFSCTLDDIEIKLIDDILITCSVHIVFKVIEFPLQLSIWHSHSDRLNSKESISIIKFDITPNHLERIIKIRNQRMANCLEKQGETYNYSESDGFKIQNFDYFLQSQVFFEKFYKQDQPAKEKVVVKQERSHYKLINQI